MEKVVVTVEQFVEWFPEFADNTNNSAILTRAQCYITTDNYGDLCGDCRILAIYLMTAHLLTLQDMIANGDTSGGMETSASIDKVSVTLTPPPSTNAFDYWLGLTKYGTELLALLQSKISTPILVGGSFVRVLT